MCNLLFLNWVEESTLVYVGSDSSPSHGPERAVGIPLQTCCKDRATVLGDAVGKAGRCVDVTARDGPGGGWAGETKDRGGREARLLMVFLVSF